jgi:hypothetical protein
MPKIIRLRVGLALMVVLSSLAFGVSTASAVQGDTITCAFTGLAGTLVPPVNGALGGPNDGSYTFSSTVPATNPRPTCVGTDIDGTATGVYQVDIESAGYYSNLVCGTGSVAGSAGVGNSTTIQGLGPSEVGAGSPPVATTPPPTWYVPQGATIGANNGLANNWTAVGYGIDFDAGDGTLGGGAVTPSSDTDAFYVSGSVAIVDNTNTVPCSGPVGAFRVAGAFTAS